MLLMAHVLKFNYRRGSGKKSLFSSSERSQMRPADRDSTSPSKSATRGSRSAWE